MSVQNHVRRSAQSYGHRNNLIQPVPLRHDMHPSHLARQLAPTKPRTKNDLIELCKKGCIQIMRNLNVRAIQRIVDHPKTNTGYWTQGIHPTVGYMTGYLLWTRLNMQRLPSIASSSYGLPTKQKKPLAPGLPTSRQPEIKDHESHSPTGSYHSRPDAKVGSYDQPSMQHMNSASVFHPVSMLDPSPVRPITSTRSMSDMSTHTVDPPTSLPLSSSSLDILSLPSLPSPSSSSSSSSPRSATSCFSSKLIPSEPPSPLLNMSDLVLLPERTQIDPETYRSQFRNTSTFRPPLTGTVPASRISLRSRVDHYISRLRPQLSQRDRIVVWMYLECWGHSLLEDKLKAAMGLLSMKEMDESEHWFLEMLRGALDGDRENYRAGVGSAFLNVNLSEVADLQISRLTPVSTFGTVVSNLNEHLAVEDGNAKQLIVFWLQDMLTATPVKVKIYLHENALQKVEIPRVGTKIQLHGVYVGRKTLNSANFLFGSAKSVLF